MCRRREFPNPAGGGSWIGGRRGSAIGISPAGVGGRENGFFFFSGKGGGEEEEEELGGAFFSRKCDGGGGKIKGRRWKRSGFVFVNGGGLLFSFSL